LTPNSYSELVELIHVADYHELRLLPASVQSTNTSSFRTIGEAIDCVSKLAAYLTELKAKISEIGRLCDGLKERDAVSISALNEIYVRLSGAAQILRNLRTHETARKTLGRFFDGAATHKENAVQDNILIARQLIDLTPEMWNAIIASMQQGTFPQFSELLDSALRAETNASASLSALEKTTGIKFGGTGLQAEWTATERALRSAAEDRQGLFVHSHLYTLIASLQKHPLSEIVEQLRIERNDLISLSTVSEALFARSLAREVYSEYGSILSKRTGADLLALRTEIAALDRDIISNTHDHLRAKIKEAGRPPAGNGKGAKSTWSEYSLINNEVEKKKRHIPLRDLTARAGSALLELMPCWMMSPLAVAQYIPEGTAFDIVVIDEASQMTPEDAIGAIRRGKQVMIVGDTNQLPPTTFFKKLLDQEEDDEDEVVVEESILDLANSAFRPKRRLRWHYRSRDSGLIAFSNEYVYDRSLVFFPSPSEGRPDMGVKFVKVEGNYSSGTNPAEARAMVNQAIQFMKRFPDRSLGLVTMNQKQQELMISEMEAALSRDQKALNYISDWKTRNDGLEEFFIKNLENVQGDERDAIFIGTVYGPSAPGEKVHQRFGPINGVAGKRRLNVLFTRAKMIVVTFSSMSSEDIRDADSNAGVQLLKKWLDYSATGMLAPNTDAGREADSDFELHVMDQLRSIGCEPISQVGVEGYFIDIGVRHPKWPYGMIMGVECDGATYHSSKSARDRDRLRQEVLEGLGWHLYRIWSTDWFNDPISETAKLKIAVETRLTELQASVIDLPPEFFRKETSAESGNASPDRFKQGIAGFEDLTTSVLHPQTSFSFGANSIDVGDQITIRYLDGSQQTRTVTLSESRNEPGQGLIAVWAPLGDALRGAEVGEEIEFEVAGQVRSVKIEKVEKPSAR
jgi:very-short-patch-repair endonuclease